ncbi:MAG TPA: 4Fe-4S binding protein [Clostridia bacterium]|jgi:Pyruvate/2-oxoacid:ferredoxin oxidoreductase delta subunit|nr:4Fe-4S binding protein [Clostridia bacterium]
MAYSIDKNECLVCGYCEFVCPFSAISLVDDCYSIDPAKCRSCAQCFDACIKGAVVPEKGTVRITSVAIVKDNCIGCSLCQRNCPAHAISGVMKQPFTIDQSRCIKCGVCLTKCKKDAIAVAYA